MQKLLTPLYETKEVCFPVEDKHVCVIGGNGSGKTLLMNRLNEYWEAQGESVLYFQDDRFFAREAANSLWSLFANDFLEKYRIRTELMNLSEMEGQFIQSGYQQIINFFAVLENVIEPNGVIVIIDEPERHLQLNFQRELMRDLKNHEKVKKLIVTTHSPEIFMEFHQDRTGVAKAYDIKEFYL